MIDKVAFEKECVECGKVFRIGPHENRKSCCSIECKLKHQRKVDAERYAINREERIEKQKEYDKEKQQVKKRPGKKRGPSVTEIAVAAGKEHMTYGQYVAKYGL